jgi:catechol 2,3-dioxygenase-like lactoylglutathione lyase family enzyme
MIKSLAHVCIKTTDLEKTSDFYCGALGMVKAFQFTRKGEVIGFYLKASEDTFIEVFRVDHADHTTTGHKLSHFCLQTDAIEDIRRRLEDRGYAPREITMGADNTTQFWVVDPNDLDIEFQQYTENSSQFTGKDVEVNW